MARIAAPKAKKEQPREHWRPRGWMRTCNVDQRIDYSMT